MGYKINGTTITLTRGDTFKATIGMVNESDGSPYIPQQGDSVRFAVKHEEYIGQRYTELKDAEPLILKEIPIDTLLLHLNPEDTKPLGFGSYLYDIELTMADGTVTTFIQDAKFILTTEVH